MAGRRCSAPRPTTDSIDGRRELWTGDLCAEAVAPTPQIHAVQLSLQTYCRSAVRRCVRTGCPPIQTYSLGQGPVWAGSESHMPRLIDPPRTALDRLLTPLTSGEREVIELFDARLPPEWEFYVQPHLNGLRPDLVLLHPDVGIAVFEIKDWDLDALPYTVEINPRSGDPRLMARNTSGRKFSHENPVDQIRLYKSELFDLYCPRLNDGAGFATITAGLIFTRSDRAKVDRLLAPFRSRDEGMTNYPNYWPLAGADDLRRGDLDAVFPEWKRRSSKFMSPMIADDLRGWLKEPAFSQEQRLPLQMDAKQRDLATTRTETGFRRVKGPAGSGKSVVLAARAAELADEGKQVLVATFNITLLNYLRDLAVRHATSRRVIRRQVDFVNFHLWCKRACSSCGQQDAYKRVWAQSSDGDDLQPEPVLQDGLAALVQSLYDDPDLAAAMPRYDAILVDEGQDYRPIWWQTLRNAVRPGGEMILVADKTQNIYATAAAWTEDAMANAGFRGPWSELRISYRLPPVVIPLLKRFADSFLASEEVDVPQVEQRADQMEFSDLFPVELRWIQVRAPQDAVSACVDEVIRQMERLRPDTAIPDITFLSGRKVGSAVVEAFENRGVHVLHTFDPDKSKGRRQKRAFFQGSAKVKATTLHSFKGWEARHLVLFVGNVEKAEDRALLYTALTRLRRHENGSALSVVSCCTELDSFGREWPEFVAV